MQGGEREMEMNLNKLSEIERSDWSRAISSKRDVAYGLAPKGYCFDRAMLSQESTNSVKVCSLRIFSIA